MELPSLPLPVLQNVLAFAVPGYADYKPPEWRNTRVVSVLKCLKLVSKAWAALIREIIRQYEDPTLILRFKPSWTPPELDHMYQNVSEREPQITEKVEIDWPRIFANLPTLKTLNLEANYIDSRHVIGALDAAATHCLNLETLVLPSQHFRGDDESIQAVLEKLYAAMKSWRLHGNRGGLRHLKVPLTIYRKKFKASKQFFENVIENCPNVEYLDGYKASLSKIAGLTCKDGWLLTLEDWERLNAACTQLREFDWVVAPFGDPFFRVFGEHVKPQMKKLTFGVNMRWNWRRYFHDCNKAAGVHPDEDWDDDNYGNRQGRLDKHDDLNTLLTDVFGDLIVPQSVLKSLASDSWTGGSINEFIDAGYRVLLLANEDTGLAYGLYDFCGGHEILTTEYIDTLPDSSHKIDGLEIYGNNYFLRSYQAELRYISLSDEGVLTEEFETFLNSSNIDNFVRWNMHLVATYMVDGAKMSALVWSWTENEPSVTTSEASVLMNTSGRWVASTSATKTYKACWSSSSLTWSSSNAVKYFSFARATSPWSVNVRMGVRLLLWPSATSQIENFVSNGQCLTKVSQNLSS
ncbi:hypothetical protein PC129_g2377 [Phytophthora cactorum]|uniref:Leucine-rich repeat domain, L domain-like n=2 Tax=Phytophthora cactorum TaxID=29920 RepID=A0A8T1IQX2_9STRA|nr:hypothetical protein PC129_g2377 [Phytophthora cactorum]